MKLNFKNILAAAALSALFVSCDRTAEFEPGQFVSLDHYAYSVKESVGELTIPVHVYNHTSEVQVSVSVLANTAVEGTDYELVTPASGVLTFAPGETTKSITFTIKSFLGTYTGAKNFGVKIASATDGVTVGNVNSASVTINDEDHPLSMFLGDWTGTFNTGGGTYAGHTISITAVEGDVTKVYVNNLEPYFANAGLVAPDYNVFVGVVNEDKTVITLALEQPIGYQGAYLVGYADPDGETTAADVTMVLNEDGTLTIPNFWGIYGGGWFNYCFGPTVLSK